MYTFLPYFRKGLLNLVGDSDSSSIPSLEVKLKLNTPGEISRTVQLLTSRNVTGINPRAIIKTYPRPYSLEMTPGDLAYIEFYEEDIPWRYSPGTPNENRILPWLRLLAFKQDEIKENFTTLPLPTFKILDLDIKEQFQLAKEEAWAFAHVQINGFKEGTIATYLKNNPNAGISRVICPRKLIPNTRYIAFLIPTNYEKVDDLVPYYYRWEFTTASDGNFETMARRLKTVSSEQIELPKIDVSNLDSTTGALSMPSLFMPPNKEVEKFEDLEAKKFLFNQLKREGGRQLSGGVPLLSLIPFYGIGYSDETNLGISKNNWLSTINLDPRYRAIAQIGQQIVRENQEQFMAWAWNQAGDLLEELNQKIKRANFASKVGEVFLKKHIGANSGKTKEDLLGYTRPIHPKIEIEDNGKTIYDWIKNSILSKGATDSAFQKILQKTTKNRNSVKEFIEGFESGTLKAATNLFEEPVDLIPVTLKTSSNSEDEKAIKNFNAVKKYEYNQFDSPELIEASSFFNPNNFEDDNIIKVLNPKNRQKDIVLNEYQIEGEDVEETILQELKPFAVFPTFSGVSIYSYFKNTAPNLVFPRLNEIPSDTVMLFEPNPAFIECLMVGVNQELSNEFRWREFPCNLQDTYFKQFWDYTDNLHGVRDDIRSIVEWGKNDKLGENNIESSQSNSIVFLIKSKLLEKFPNTILYLGKAEQEDGDRILASGENNKIYPSFRATLEPNTIMLRFDDVNVEKIRSGDGDGWFFVFQERPGEIRFGFENNQDSDFFILPDDLDSAQVALMLLQKPVKIAIHGEDLIDFS